MTSTKEQVMVIPSDLKKDGVLFDSVGFTPMTDDRLEKIMGSLKEEYWFHYRDEAEKDVSLLQVIPYVLITRPSTAGEEYYAYQRTNGGGDSRLYGAASLGLGGHVNPCDHKGGTINEILLNNIRRELDEEVDIFNARGDDIEAKNIKADRFKCIGAIYSDDSAVSKVHYGLIYQLDLNDKHAQTALRETYKMRDLGWFDADMLSDYSEDYEFESWSRLIVDHLKG